MRTPTPYEIRVALETHLFGVLQPAFEAGQVVIVQPGEDIKPDLDKVQVLHVVTPGTPTDGELGGRQGVSPRPGVYVITLSVPQDTIWLQDAWELCGVLEAAFYRVFLPVLGLEYTVLCTEPYTTNVGEDPDTKRLALSVTVPWSVWAGGYED